MYLPILNEVRNPSGTTAKPERTQRRPSGAGRRMRCLLFQSSRRAALHSFSQLIYRCKRTKKNKPKKQTNLRPLAHSVSGFPCERLFCVAESALRHCCIKHAAWWLSALLALPFFFFFPFPSGHMSVFVFFTHFCLWPAERRRRCTFKKTKNIIYI